MQGGDDFPGSQVPIRERHRILPWIILAIIVVIVALYAASIWLNWTILETMYGQKAGLDWFGINFYGGLTFLVSAILALFFINPFPRRSDLFESFNALIGLQYRQTPFGGFGGGTPQRRVRPLYIRPSKLLWGFWQFLKWTILFALFSLYNGFPGFGNLTIVFDMALKGYGSWSLVPTIATLPIHTATAQEIISLVPTMEIQYQILVYFASVLMVAIALRFFLKFIRDVVIRAGDKWLRDIFVALSAVVFSVFVGIPYWGMDITIPYEWGAVTTVLASFVVLAIFFHIRSTRETIPLAQRRRTAVIIAALIIIGLLLFNLGAFTYFRLNFNNNYIAYQWDPLVSKQVAVGSWAAGIQNVTYTDISHIPSGNASTTLSLIRNWDTNSSYTQSQNEIGVNWLHLAPPSIVYVYGQEYWVTPTTFNYPDPNDWIGVHLIYTHSSKIIALNTHTGDFVNVTQAFRLPSQPLMYYGEDLVDEPGFANDVYVHAASSVQEIENVSYSGSPDYTLCGAQRALWFLEQGQLGYAFSPPQDCIQMLHDREVFQRVQNVLIGGLIEDGSTYLVTDSAQKGGNNLYFAIQVFVDYPLHSGFANVPNTPLQDYLRFFGVVLVNVATGQMQGYTVPGNDNFLTSFYKQYYPSWGPVPSWLQPQLRYPEQLLGNQYYLGQLDADFYLHVNTPSIFRSGSDFFERPSNTEVLYIPFVSGNNVSFDAVQLVEFMGSTGKNLAGLYVTSGGGQLGQMTLYQANSTVLGSVPLLGPTAALNAFKTDYATQQAVTLTQATPGNILLYPVNGHLYYFIPAYIHQSSGTSVIERNPFVDVIDGENSSAPVHLIPTNSSLILTYGLPGVSTGPIFTNSTLRTQYVNELFTARGIQLSNSSVANVNIVDKIGTTTYQTVPENSSATSFVNNFIKSYVTNTSITGGKIAFGNVFYWVPSVGTVNFGFVVADQGVTKLY
ncbi:MAG: hypothetical protein OK439_04775, partial [Thaumarchaeota archaeon]|nr:hypothetical protein [Nitrososphaerota archaeon]